MRTVAALMLSAMFSTAPDPVGTTQSSQSASAPQSSAPQSVAPEPTAHRRLVERLRFRSLSLTLKTQSIVGPPVDGAPIMDRVVVVDGRANEERVIFFSVDNPRSVKQR